MSTINLRSRIGRLTLPRFARGDGVWPLAGKMAVLAYELNCAKVNVPSGDTVQLLDIPIGTRVLGAILKMITLEGGTLTADIGYAGGYEFWQGVNLNSATGYAFKNSADDTGGTAARIVTVLMNNAADVARIKLGIVCVQMP